MINYYIKGSLYALFAGALISGCSLPDPVTSSEPPALGFHAEQELSLITLSWDPVLVTGFKEYIILQSADEIPSSSEPEVNAGVTVIKRIDDKDVHVFHTSDALFSGRSCYKLYVAIDDRFLQSGNVCVDHNASFIDGFYDRIAHDAGESEIVMYDRNIIRLSSYDLEDGIIRSTIPESFFSIPTVDVSGHEGKREAFLTDESNAVIKRYNMPELNGAFSRNFGAGIDALVSYGPFVFVAFSNSVSSFQVLNRNTLNAIDIKQGLGPQPGRSIAVFPGDPLIVLEISPATIKRYTIDATGHVTQEDSYSTSTGTQSALQNLTANSTNLFITGPIGTIINKDAEILGRLASGINSFILASRITEDEKQAVSLISTGQNTELRFFDISNLQQISLTRTIPLPQGTFADLIIENDIVHVFALTFDSGTPKTVILKYPLS
jgi:hypothetical protein